MIGIYLTISLSTHDGDDTPQNYEKLLSHEPLLQTDILLSYHQYCITFATDTNP